MKGLPVPSSFLRPFSGVSPACPRVCCTGQLRTGTQHSSCHSAVLSRGEGPSPSACWLHPWCILRGCWPFLPPYWLVFSLESTRTSRYFSVKLLPKPVAHSVFCSSSLPFVELSEIHFCHFISLSRHPWMWAQPSGVSATPPRIVSSVNLQKVQSVPSFWSLIKLLSSSSCIISPWLHH